MGLKLGLHVHAHRQAEAVLDVPVVGLKPDRRPPAGRLTTVLDVPVVGLKRGIEDQGGDPAVVLDVPVVGLKLYLVSCRILSGRSTGCTRCGLETPRQTASGGGGRAVLDVPVVGLKPSSRRDLKALLLTVLDVPVVGLKRSWGCHRRPRRWRYWMYPLWA